MTVTDVFALADPPAPVHVMLYVALEVGETDTEPEVPEAVKPLAVHEVALVLLQVSVDDWPEVMEVGLALNEAVGAGVVGGVTLPPIVNE